MIIFNNGSGSQTADLTLVNNAVYNTDGTASIGTIASDGLLKVYVSGSCLVIESPADTCVKIYSADGIARTINISAGVNLIDTLPPGFYIVAGKKIML